MIPITSMFVGARRRKYKMLPECALYSFPCLCMHGHVGILTTDHHPCRSNCIDSFRHSIERIFQKSYRHLRHKDIIKSLTFMNLHNLVPWALIGKDRNFSSTSHAFDLYLCFQNMIYLYITINNNGTIYWCPSYFLEIPSQYCQQPSRQHQQGLYQWRKQYIRSHLLF